MVTAHKQRTAIIGMTVLCFLLISIWSLAPHPALIAVLCLVPFGILFVLNQTFWLVSLFVLFSFFRIHEAFPALYSLKIPLLLSLGALSALMWHTIISRQVKTYWHPNLTQLAAFWLLVIIGIVFASNPGISIAFFKNIYWKIIVMTLAIAWLVDTEDAVKKIATLIIISGILISGVAIFNSLNGIGLVEGTRVTIGRHLGSMLGDPNDLSLVLMFPLAFAISFATTKNIGMARLLGIVGVLLAIWAVLATQSRGGLLGSL
ncbi:membrane protein, partial [Vibrio sinaloensis]